MRIFSLLFSILFVAGWNPSKAQSLVTEVVQLKLPENLTPGGREVSGLVVKDGRLYFLSENRDDHLKVPSAGIYSLPLEVIGTSITTSAPLPAAQLHEVAGLETMMKKLNGYQGLESIAFIEDRFYITVETELPVDSCYILTGSLRGGTFMVDTNLVVAIPKPRLANGDKVFNAGFESLVAHKGNLYAFFEYNKLHKNLVYRITPNDLKVNSLPVDQPIPFRLTDATHWRGREVIASNYFFPLKAEAIYQRDLTEKEQQLINKQDGGVHSYARLAVLRVGKRRIRVRRYIELPETWWTSNWEGIASFEGGVLLVNDKFIRSGGNETQLIYVPLP